MSKGEPLCLIGDNSGSPSGGNISEAGTVSYRLAHAPAQRAGQPPSH